MSKLDNAMKKYMEYLSFVEQKPFSYLDFREFKVDGESHHMEHGTFRNKVSGLTKKGMVEWVYDSPQGFYVFKGSGQNSNEITNDDHTGVNHPNYLAKDKIMNQSSRLVDEVVLGIGSGLSTKNPRIITNNPLYRYVKSIPFEQRSVHDIRLSFKVPWIWIRVYTILSIIVNGNHEINKSKLHGLKIENRSKDIYFPQLKMDNLNIKVRIHKSDKVSVIIGCSYRPVTLDVEGIQRLSKALSLVQMELTRLVSGIEKDSIDVVARENWDRPEPENGNARATGTSSPIESMGTPVIPRFTDWIVTMWHYGVDAVHEYSREKFNCRWELAQNIVVSIYSKDQKISENGNNNTRKTKGSGNGSVKSRIRVERQEYPKVSLERALMNKCPEVVEALEK